MPVMHIPCSFERSRLAAFSHFVLPISPSAAHQSYSARLEPAVGIESRETDCHRSPPPLPCSLYLFFCRSRNCLCCYRHAQAAREPDSSSAAMRVARGRQHHASRRMSGACAYSDGGDDGDLGQIGRIAENLVLRSADMPWLALACHECPQQRC